MVIDHLGSGGAERQFCMVARQLKTRGFDVHAIVFQPNDFSAHLLHGFDIPITTLAPRNGFHLLLLMRAFLKRADTQVVIAFLKWSALAVELSSAYWRRFAVIVSERSMELSGRSVKQLVRYNAHVLADAVVCNSYAQRDQLLRVVPWMARRISVIVNGVDLELFRPGPGKEQRGGVIRMLVLARYSEQKNPFGLLEGIGAFLKEHPTVRFEVDWYGHFPRAKLSKRGRLRAHYRSERASVSVHRRLSTAIAQHGLEGQFRLHEVRRDVVSLYRLCDVVCLPSFYEGCSNVIGEALACGVPVLASDVSDNGRLVKEGITGFLFDPMSTRSIADAIARCAAKHQDGLTSMSGAAREIARTQLSPETLGDRFANLIAAVVGGQLSGHR